MKTITVREASNRIARYRGVQELEITEKIGGGSVGGQFYGYEEYRKVAKSLADPS